MDADKNPDTDAHANNSVVAEAQGFADSHSDARGNVDRVTDGDALAHENSDQNADAGAHGHADRDADSDSDANVGGIEATLDAVAAGRGNGES
jgi:hypothetical protein